MNIISKEEYLKLINNLENEEGDDLDLFEEEYVPPEPVHKNKPQNNKIIDITNFKKNDLFCAINNNNIFKIGNFLLKLNNTNSLFTIDAILEKKFKTLSGLPCNIDMSINYYKDKRFLNVKFADNLKSNNNYKFTANETIEIIRWLQILNKMPAFI